MGPVRDRVALPLIGVLSLVVVLVVAVLLLGHTPGRGGRADVAALPALNALLNGASAGLLMAGYRFVRQTPPRRPPRVHAGRVLRLGAVPPLLHHVSRAGRLAALHRAGVGTRWVYFPLLISHIVLAAVMVPFVLTTLYRALGGDFVRHARLARLTLPVWIYVSVTGVAVYVMLYLLPGGR